VVLLITKSSSAGPNDDSRARLEMANRSSIGSWSVRRMNLQRGATFVTHIMLGS
jgi:hypothetical protein